MAKKENLKEFVIQQSDIDKALKYHLAKAVSHSNPKSKDHSDLANHLNCEEFYSYVIETVNVVFVLMMDLERFLNLL